MAKYNLFAIPITLKFKVTSVDSGSSVIVQDDEDINLVTKVICLADCKVGSRSVEDYSFLTTLETIQKGIAVHPYGAIIVTYDTGVTAMQCDVGVLHKGNAYVAASLDLFAAKVGDEITFTKVSA